MALDMDLETLAAKLELAEPKERRKLSAETAKDASQDDLPKIVKLLGHAQEPVRLGAIEILAMAKFRPALKYLAAVTVQKSGDEQVLAARAVTILARPGDRGALEKLARSWMAKPNHHLKDCAAKLLVKLGTASSERQAEKVAAEPVEADEPVIPGSGITSKDAAQRKEAIERTIAEADDAGQIFVDALLEKQPPGIRLELVNALERLGAEPLAKASITLLPKHDSTVVTLLARALTRRIGELPASRVSEVCEALDLSRRRLYGDELVNEAVDQCLRAAGR